MPVQVDQALVRAMTERSPQLQDWLGKNWPAYKNIIDAQKQTYGATPGYDGIYPPREEYPNSKVIDADELMADQANKQTMEQPDYLPPVSKDIYNPQQETKEHFENVLRLLKNFNQWRQGESH